MMHYLKRAILIGCTMSMAMGGENESSPQSAEAKPSPARLRGPDGPTVLLASVSKEQT